MAKINKENEEENKYKYVYEKHKHHNYNHGSHDALYGLGVIGALFYFLQSASNFQEVMIGIGKAVFWPAILMFKLLTYLQL